MFLFCDSFFKFLIKTSIYTLAFFILFYLKKKYDTLNNGSIKETSRYRFMYPVKVLKRNNKC